MHSLINQITLILSGVLQYEWLDNISPPVRRPTSMTKQPMQRNEYHGSRQRASISGSFKQESRAVAREPRDAAAVVFRLKFADNIQYKFKSNQVSKACRLQSSIVHTYRRKTEFNAKWHSRSVFWSQWKGDKGLSNTKY